MESYNIESAFPKIQYNMLSKVTRFYSLKVQLLKIIVFALFMQGCEKKIEFVRSEKLSSNIYVEEYKSLGGVHGSNYYYYYITDSLRFRKYVGSHDEKGSMKFVVNSNRIIVKKYQLRAYKEIIDSTYFDISFLKKQSKKDE